MSTKAGVTTASGVTIGEPRQVVPGPHIPAKCRVMRSNNNLDIALFEGRLWLAWRTSSSHFAGANSAINIISSPDLGKTWTFEKLITPDRDLREPRFLVWDEQLLLYWFEAGTSPVKFEPGRIFVSRKETGGWTEPTPISEPGYVVWRPRVIAGRALMSVYSGGETIYTTHPRPTGVELWESANGIDWRPIDGENRVVHTGGTEMDFALLDDGGLLAITRKEGPHGGWGTDVCRADSTDWTRWQLRSDPRKLDSPLMVQASGRYFVIARRQVGFGGRYDLKLGSIPAVLRTRLYQAAYWITPKRTAIWEIDPEKLEFKLLADFPSRGDTAFAGIVETAPGEWLVYNYSSPLQERDRVWIDGQLSATNIYATTLTVD